MLSYKVYSILFALAIAAITYLIGIWLSKKEDEKVRKRITTLGVVLVIGTLCFLKFTNTAIDFLNQFDSIFNISWNLPFKEGVLMPLAISYYAMMAVSYMIDCYWEKISPEKNPLKVLLFLVFFPQLLQGPFSRYDQLSKELCNEKKFELKNIKYGVQLMLWGIFQIMVVADKAGVYVDKIFHGSDAPYGLNVIIGLIAYTIQLYASFSGGIDFIRGVAECFGINMVENFRQPFLSRSLAEFWRRWHITLGAWMKDYIFYPFQFSTLVKKQKKALRKKFDRKTVERIFIAVADIIVFLVVGFWHGTGSIFWGWGLYNGIIIGASELLTNPYSKIKTKLHIKEEGFPYQAFCVVRTFIVVIIGFLFDCSSTAAQAFVQFGNIFRLGSMGGVTKLGVALLAFTAIMVAVDFIHEKGISIREFMGRQNFFVQVIFWTLLLQLIVCFADTTSGSALMYANF